MSGGYVQAVLAIVAAFSLLGYVLAMALIVVGFAVVALAPPYFAGRYLWLRFR